MITPSETGLAATKLHPPASPSHLVPRARLDAVLDAAADRRAPLVLVSAPAGSGKSTLVSSWAAGRSGSVAWLQVEASDADPTRFWSSLVDSIGQASSIPTTDLRATVVASNGDELAVVTALVNALAAAGEPVVVVVDDYHLLDHDGVQRGMERFVDLCPPTTTVVLVTRIDPPFRLGRLRLQGRLGEIRADDLRFATDEAAALLAPSRLLDPSQVDRICERTEGWAAGLVLAGLSLERATDPDAFIDAFRGDDHLVVEYLRDELLESLTPDDRLRLLETSVLDQLTGPLVDAVTGHPGGAAWLRDTAAANRLLIGLDRTGTWFRYHHLLRDLLRLEAAQSLPERLPDLHRAAARWFESEDDLHRATMHLLAAGDLDAAAHHLRVLGPRLVADGQIETLTGLLDQLGDRTAEVWWLGLLAGWSAFIGGRYGQAGVWLERVRAAAPPDFDPAIADPLAINLDLARGDVGEALERARHLTDTDQIASHTCDLATATGAAFAWAGLADDARRALGHAVDKATVERIPTAHVLALVYRAVIELEAGTPAAAQQAAAIALDTATSFGLTDYHGVAPAYAVRGRTGVDPVAAAADAQHALTLARRAATDLVLGYVLAVCGDTLADLDPDHDAGTDLLAEAGPILARGPDPGIAGTTLDRARSRHRIAIEETRGRAVDPVHPLTDRELAVLHLLPSARSQREIATELYVSLNTVKTHCRAIYRKLGVSDRRAAVQAARERGLL